MKLILGIVAVFGVMLLTSGSLAAEPAPSNGPSNDARELVSVIDDIDVPVAVLISVQSDHLGYAVTQADEVSSGGEEGYRLRLNRDDRPNGGEGIYLTFDKNWELIDEQERAAAPEPEDDDDDDEQERRRSEEEDDDDEDDEPGPVGGSNRNGPPEGRPNNENENNGNGNDDEDDDDDDDDDDGEDENEGNGNGNSEQE